MLKQVYDCCSAGDVQRLDALVKADDLAGKKLAAMMHRHAPYLYRAYIRVRHVETFTYLANAYGFPANFFQQQHLLRLYLLERGDIALFHKLVELCKDLSVDVSSLISECVKEEHRHWFPYKAASLQGLRTAPNKRIQADTEEWRANPDNVVFLFSRLVLSSWTPWLLAWATSGCSEATLKLCASKAVGLLFTATKDADRLNALCLGLSTVAGRRLVACLSVADYRMFVLEGLGGLTLILPHPKLLRTAYGYFCSQDEGQPSQAQPGTFSMSLLELGSAAHSWAARSAWAAAVYRTCLQRKCQSSA